MTTLGRNDQGAAELRPRRSVHRTVAAACLAPIFFIAGACSSSEDDLDAFPGAGGAGLGGSPAATGGAPSPSGGAPTGTGNTPSTGGGIGGLPTTGAGGGPTSGGAPAAGGFPSGGAASGGAAPGTGSAPSTGGAPGVPSDRAPVIPTVTGECPAWRSGTISYMGLGGITIAAGARASGPTAPMLFYWHGTGSSAGEFNVLAAPVAQGVQSQGGIVVSFQGTTGGDLLSGTSIFGRGDFDITDQLLACAVRDHNIDPRRIFAMGCSAGGLFSAAMAALRSNYIAAAAPNSGGWVAPVQWQSAFTPALMTVHGAAGTDVVIVDFSQTSNTADKAFKARGGFVINCDHGGGHCAGGGLAGDVWKFFQAHPYGVTPYPWASGLPAGFNSKCKIFTG